MAMMCSIFGKLGAGLDAMMVMLDPSESIQIPLHSVSRWTAMSST